MRCGCARAHRASYGGDASEISRRGNRSQGLQRGVPRLSVARFVAAGNVPNRGDERVVAVCRCLEWPQAVSGCLSLAATLTNRPGG